MDEKENKKTFKSLMTTFAETTSIPGVPRIRSSIKISIKVFWTILLVCAIGAVSLHLYYLSSSFLKWPRKTTLTLGFNNLHLPTLTFCNANPLQKTYLPSVSSRLQAIVDKATYAYAANLDIDFENDNSSTSDEYSEDQDQFELLLDEFRIEYMKESRDDRILYGHTIEEMLVRCRIGKYTCDEEDFTEFLSSEYGNCFSLKALDAPVESPGPGSGLAVVLFLQNHEYLPGITDGYGVRVHIHAPNTLPFPYESGFFIQAGQETSISLKQSILERIGQPYGECETSDEFNKLYGKEYNRQSCQFLCETTTMLQKCGCYSEDNQEHLQNTNISKGFCQTDEEIRCMEEVSVNVDSKSIICDCPDPCSEIAYSLNIASRQWPTDEFAPLLVAAACYTTTWTEDCDALNNSTEEALRRQFIKLIVYYEELNFSKVKEEAAIETVQFISDMGGAMGLWIGFTALGLCELIQLLAELFHFLISKCCQTKKGTAVGSLQYR